MVTAGAGPPLLSYSAGTCNRVDNITLDVVVARMATSPPS